MDKIKITNEAIHEIYKLAVRVYENQLTKTEASDIALSEQLMSKASAIFYIDVFKFLVLGKTYKKTINLYATEYFLNSIYSDFGLEVFNKAIDTVKKHLEYYKQQGKGDLKSIRKLISELESKHDYSLLEVYPNEIKDGDEYIEGARYQLTVNAYERNKKARDKCIDKYGLNCQVCNINFELVYGELGKGFIHVHHIVDIATVSKEYNVNPEMDLIPVCPNCHAMLHKEKPAMSVEKLKNLIKQSNSI
jgi:5-methylcytosine-specific restriction protein A